MQKYLKCLDSSPENGTFDMFCTSDHGNISFHLGNIFYGFQLADSMVTLGEPRDGYWLGVGERVISFVGYIQQIKALLASSREIHW